MQQSRCLSGTYRQLYPNPYTLVFPGGVCRMSIPVGTGGVVQKAYVFDTEFIPGGTSASGEVTAEVIYVGYGISAPELGYDDYKGVDVRGKIVLMEPEVPVASRGDALDLFKKWRPSSFHQYKLKIAADHGAKGMIYNYGPIGNPNNAYVEGFVYHHVGTAVVADVFAGTGRVHKDTVDLIRKELKPRSFATGKTMTISNKSESGYLRLRSLWDEAALVREVTDWLGGVALDRIECLWEPGMLLAARLRETLGVPGLGVAQTIPFRDKEQMKIRLDQAGIRTPRHQAARGGEQIVAAAERIGYPLIVKPIAGAGSADTYRVEDPGELARVLPKVGHVAEVSVEEFVDGEEYTYDTVSIDGIPAFHNIAWYRPRPLVALGKQQLLEPAHLTPRRRLRAARAPAA